LGYILGGEIPETGSEKCMGIKKTMKSESEKKDKKGRTKKKEKKKGAKQRCNFFLLLYKPAVDASYLQSQFQFYGQGIAEK